MPTRRKKSESRPSAAYPTEPSERGASAVRLDVGSASQTADALLAPVNDVVPRARLANAEKQVGSRATGRRERSRSAVALDQYSAAVVRPLTGSAFVAPVGRASAQRGVSVKSPAGAPSSVIGAHDDDDSESDVDAASTSMPPPSRAARSVPLRRSSAASSAVALNQAAASSPSDGFRIMVNGIACDLEAPRVIPDLLFGPRVLLLDATTQRLLLPNGIDHSVRVVPGREYTTVRLRGGAADVEGAGHFIEDRRLVPRSWPLDTVSAHYRAGAADFYANVPSVGEHIARYVQESEAALSQQEVTLNSATQPEDDEDDEPLVDPADVDLSHLPKEERRARRNELRQAYKKKRKEEKRRKRAAMGGRYHPLVVKLPTVREALKDHPATISAEQNAAFVALRDAFNEAATGFNRGASLRGSTAAASAADASPSQRIRFRPGASQGHLAAGDEDGPASAEPSFVRNEAALRSWAASVVGRMHKDLNGLTVYTREHPNVGFGAALAAYHKLPADEKDKYTEMAKDINAAARELDDQARSQAVAGHGGGGAGGGGGGVAGAGMSGVHSFLGQTQTQLQSQRGRALSADSGTSAESGESVMPPTPSSSARSGPTQTQTQQHAQPKQRRRARTPQSDSTITPVRPAGRRHRSEQPPTAASGPPLFQGDSGPVGSGVFSQAQAMRAAIEARQSAAGPLVSAVSSANPTPRASTAFGAAAMSTGRMTAAASQGASTLGFLGSQLSQQDPHGGAAGGDDNDGDDDDSFMW